MAGGVEFLGRLEHCFGTQGSPGVEAGEQSLEFADDLLGGGSGFQSSWTRRSVPDTGGITRQAGVPFAVALNIVGRDLSKHFVECRGTKRAADPGAVGACVEIELHAKETLAATKTRRLIGKLAHFGKAGRSEAGRWLFMGFTLLGVVAQAPNRNRSRFSGRACETSVRPVG